MSHRIFTLTTLILLTACTGKATQNGNAEYYTAFRQGFAEATQASCLNDAGKNDEFTQKLCSCVAKTLSEGLSENDMNEFRQTGRQPLDIEQRHLQAVQVCNKSQ